MKSLLVLSLVLLLRDFLWPAAALPLYNIEKRSDNGSLERNTDLHDYIISLYENVRGYREKNCIAHFNGQKVSYHICEGNPSTLMFFMLLSQTESTCKMNFEIFLESNVTTAQYYLYKLLTPDQNFTGNRSVYVKATIQGRTVVLNKIIDMSTSGWLAFNISEMLKGYMHQSTKLTVELYIAERNNFFDCSAVASMFDINRSNGTDDTASFVKVRVKSNSTAEYNDSSLTEEEMRFNATEDSYNLDNCYDMAFDVNLEGSTRHYGAELVLHLQNTTPSLYYVFITQMVTPIFDKMITTKMIQPGSKGWQIFTLDSSANDWSEKHFHLNLKIHVWDSSGSYSLSRLQIQSLFRLDQSTANFYPLVTVFVSGCFFCTSITRSIEDPNPRNDGVIPTAADTVPDAPVTTDGTANTEATQTSPSPITALIAGATAVDTDTDTVSGYEREDSTTSSETLDDPRDQGSGCFLEEHVIDLSREVSSLILYPKTVNVGRCVGAPLRGLLMREQRLPLATQYCEPAEHRPLVVLVRKDNVFEVVVLQNRIISKCSYR